VAGFFIPGNKQNMTGFTNIVSPLIDDGFEGEPPSKRLIAHLIEKWKKGAKIVGTYCAYAPAEPIRALDLTPVSLCAFSNTRHLAELDRIIGIFKPDAVADLVLLACHSYNIESIKVENHIREIYGLPFLKIVTDYSQSDIGQIRTGVAAILETCRR
jgi:benzoyl-CoA reductase/2-hydroxyglutaryl-CoA dehydratase subunit BcrC/BadD/HgdB